MKTIWMYPLKVTDVQTINLPTDARILKVDEVNGSLFLWTLLDDQNKKMTEVAFRIVGTGHPFPDGKGCRYLNTVVTGPFVWHVFAIVEGTVGIEFAK